MFIMKITVNRSAKNSARCRRGRALLNRHVLSLSVVYYINTYIIYHILYIGNDFQVLSYFILPGPITSRNSILQSKTQHFQHFCPSILRRLHNFPSLVSANYPLEIFLIIIINIIIIVKYYQLLRYLSNLLHFISHGILKDCQILYNISLILIDITLCSVILSNMNNIAKNLNL